MTPVLGLILVGAGSSARMGGIDKVWADLGGRPLLWHALHSLSPLADRTVVVVHADHLQEAATLCGDRQGITVVRGGSQRQESVAFGLRALGSVDIVAIHDAARPLVARHLLEEGVRAAVEWGAAIPVVPIPDTVKRVDADGAVVETLDRTLLRGAQTPQVFRHDWLIAATSELFGDGSNIASSTPVYTDEASMLEATGRPVHVFPGSPLNMKVTTPLDLELARYLLRRTTS